MVFPDLANLSAFAESAAFLTSLADPELKFFVGAPKNQKQDLWENEEAAIHS